MVQSRAKTPTGLAVSACRAQRETNFKTRFRHAESSTTRVNPSRYLNRPESRSCLTLPRTVFPAGACPRQLTYSEYGFGLLVRSFTLSVVTDFFRALAIRSDLPSGVLPPAWFSPISRNVCFKPRTWPRRYRGHIRSSWRLSHTHRHLTRPCRHHVL